MPVEGIRTLIPAEFTLLGEDTGTAQLNVGVAACPSMVVDGIERGPASPGSPPCGSSHTIGAGAQRSMLWLATSDRALHRGFRELGLRSIHGRNMRMVMKHMGGSIAAEGIVPSKGRRGGYELTLDSSPLTPAPAEVDAVYWHVGKRGLARLDFAVSFREAGTGPAEVRAEQGTIIRRIAGGEMLDGGALLADFTFKGDMQLL